MRTLGLDALELGWVQSVNVSENKCIEIRETAEKEGISLSVHAPYFINLNADEGEWEKSRKRLWDAAYYGFLAGASDIVFHPGSYFKLDPKTVLEKSVHRLDNLAHELASANISVNLRPETMGKQTLLGSFEDTLYLSKKIGSVFPCLDFAHLHARAGDGSKNSKKEWDYILDQYAQVLGKLSLTHLHIHLSGIAYGQKGEKNHLPLQESDLNIIDLFKALKTLDCDGRILCESPILEEDALYMKNLWEKI